jgi:hypothetical protein
MLREVWWCGTCLFMMVLDDRHQQKHRRPFAGGDVPLVAGAEGVLPLHRKKQIARRQYGIAAMVRACDQRPRDCLAACGQTVVTMMLEGPYYAVKTGGCGRNRTYNLSVKSRMLCQLSYAPEIASGGFLL